MERELYNYEQSNTFYDEDTSTNYSSQKYNSRTNLKEARRESPLKKSIKNCLFLGKNSLPEYKISPTSIPRPNKAEDIYTAADQTNYFQTEEYSKHNIPFSHSYYVVNETKNSSIRFIRSSVNNLPTSFDKISKAGLLFGLYLQPFAKQVQGEFEVPAVESKILSLTIADSDIYRCSYCHAYVNSNFQIKDKNDKRYFLCNLCEYDTEITSSKPGFKHDYLYNDLTSCVELASPTVDFVMKSCEMKNNDNYYLFAIDISKNALDLGFSQYVRIN
jgi:hypothetical protein